MRFILFLLFLFVDVYADCPEFSCPTGYHENITTNIGDTHEMYQSVNSPLPDDGNYTRTCLSDYYVNVELVYYVASSTDGEADIWVTTTDTVHECVADNDANQSPDNNVSSSNGDTYVCTSSISLGDGMWNNGYDVYDSNGVNYATASLDQNFECVFSGSYNNDFNGTTTDTNSTDNNSSSTTNNNSSNGTSTGDTSAGTSAGGTSTDNNSTLSLDLSGIDHSLDLVGSRITDELQTQGGILHNDLLAINSSIQDYNGPGRLDDSRIVEASNNTTKAINDLKNMHQGEIDADTSFFGTYQGYYNDIIQSTSNVENNVNDLMATIQGD